MTMMEKKKTRPWVVFDHTHILLTHILPIAHYSVSISASKWEGMLEWNDVRFIIENGIHLSDILGYRHWLYRK